MKYEYEFEDRQLARIKRECHFGIISGAIAIAAALSAATAAATATVAGGIAAAGVGTATAGILAEAAVGATIGAGLGAGEAAVMGGDPGKGALGGAISGGVLAGAGGFLGSELGSAGVAGAHTIGNTVAGAGGGALSAAATGGDPLKGAISGAGSGLVKSGMEGDLFGGGTQAPVAAGPPTPGAPGAAGTAGAAGAAGSIPGVEAVTVTAPGMSGALTGGAAGALAGGMGTENVTVTGTKQPSGSAIVPGSIGKASLGGGLKTQPAAPDALSSQQTTTKDQGLGTAKTGGQMGITSGGGDTGVESITVPGVAQPQSQTGIVPTAAGLNVQSSPTGVAHETADKTTEDSDKKKEDQGYFDKLTSNTEGLFENPLALLAGGAFAADALGAFGSGGAAGTLAGGADANAKQLTDAAATDKSVADTLTNQGTKDLGESAALKSYLTSGTLPPGMQATLDAARESSIAGTRQMYSNLGMGQGNSSLTADLQNINRQTAIAQSQMGAQLYEAGTAQETTAMNMFTAALARTNAGAAIYQGLLQTNLAADENLSKSVNNFVSSLAGLSSAAKAAGTVGTA